ncbi:MAG: glycoside hydrolase [Pedobacter sp.]|nr:MAG: glycoside hydrolase [Pedobacter sp.]
MIKGSCKNHLLRFVVLAMLTLLGTSKLSAQDVYRSLRQTWLKEAEALKPVLSETVKRPLNLVQLVKDQHAFQGWKAENAASVNDFYNTSIKKQNTVILDFGEHMTGYFSFSLASLSGTPDAPVRFKLTFAEVPAEIATPYDPYKGELSRAWLQDETITVMDIPTTVRISRRMACRYVKIELVGSSQYFDFKISDVKFTAVNSAKTIPPALARSTSSMIKNIDSIGLKTLKECMQTVYEDGPKRDRRLWIGDLYLESLANAYSFKNHDLTKRCLLLLAGLSDPDGKLVGTILESPTPHPQVGQHLLDYSLLYNVTLKEYLTQTNDLETANSLWPVAKKQIEIVKTLINKNGMMDYKRASKEWWLFFDWKDGLDKEVSLQGITIFALKQTYDLAKLLNRETEVKDIPAIITSMIKAAKQNLYDPKLGLFVSGPQKQLSYASQIWMVLAGVTNATESKNALTKIARMPNALKPGGPYLYHYYVEALIKTGMQMEAKDLIVSYWGGMLSKGADTFWEVYDPADEMVSPYKFAPINSYCHAWSCTPVYFIRKYPKIFQ